MDKLFINHDEYLNFIQNIDPVAEFIEYEFILGLANEGPNIVTIDILDRLKNNDENIIEERLLDLMFDNRIFVSMESADFTNKYHKVKKVTVLSVIDSSIIDGLKTFENFYKIDEECMSEEYRELLEEITGSIVPELQEVANNKYIGDGVISFYDKNKDRIIYMNCHEGAYIISDKYEYLLK